jgi:23S rRNA (uridine2552-2'-O)-methyltransferase
MELAYAVFNLAKEVSAEKASLLVKVWDNGQVSDYVKLLREHYDICKHVKPDSSRSDSAEMFILAKGFKLPQT